MKTEKQQLINYLKSKGFTASPVLHTLSLVPHYRKTPEGHHTLISNVNCCLFEGSNTKRGELGCVTFYYGGTMKRKRHRQSISCELLKKTIVPKTAKEAIDIYEEWRIESAKIISTWKTII